MVPVPCRGQGKRRVPCAVCCVLCAVCRVPRRDKNIHWQWCGGGWGRRGPNPPCAAGCAVAARRAAFRRGTGRWHWWGNGDAPARPAAWGWKDVAPTCPHHPRGGWRAAKAPPPARLGRTLSRPSPWLGSWLPVGTGTGTRTDMAAPSQPHQATYDAIVIGAGIQGSFAAYHLAQHHRDTLLLEQVTVSPALPCPQPCHVPVPPCPQPRRTGVGACRPGCPLPWHRAELLLAPLIPGASTPVFPVPGPPCPQCQDPCVPSARAPMSPVPGSPFHAVSQRRGWQGRLCPQVPVAAQRRCTQGRWGWGVAVAAVTSTSPLPRSSSCPTHGAARMGRAASPAAPTPGCPTPA